MKGVSASPRRFGTIVSGNSKLCRVLSRDQPSGDQRRRPKSGFYRIDSLLFAQPPSLVRKEFCLDHIAFDKVRQPVTDQAKRAPVSFSFQ